MSWLQAVNDRFRAMGITGGANQECRISTQLSRSGWRRSMAVEGQTRPTASAATSGRCASVSGHSPAAVAETSMSRNRSSEKSGAHRSPLGSNCCRFFVNRHEFVRFNLAANVRFANLFHLGAWRKNPFDPVVCNGGSNMPAPLDLVSGGVFLLIGDSTSCVDSLKRGAEAKSRKGPSGKSRATANDGYRAVNGPFAAARSKVPVAPIPAVGRTAMEPARPPGGVRDRIARWA